MENCRFGEAVLIGIQYVWWVGWVGWLGSWEKESERDLPRQMKKSKRQGVCVSVLWCAAACVMGVA